MLRLGTVLRVSILIFCVAALNAVKAQPPQTMDVSNTTPYADENGVTLQDGDILHLIWAGPDGQIDPPQMPTGSPNNGLPSGDDELLETHTIGEGAPPGNGIFFFTVTTYQSQAQGKPAAGDWVYLRAFNDNNLVTATYYGDAQLHQVLYSIGEAYDPLIDMGQTDLTLPVELSAFEAIAGNAEVLLKWVTNSEVNNLGFEVHRSSEEEGDYEMIASYENLESLRGAGNSNQEHSYTFKDILVVNGATYWYKISDVDLNGIRAYHGPVSALPNANQTPISQTGNVPTQFMLHQNYPNPFNPETTIKFELPDLKNNLRKVDLVIYNALGMRVRTLYSGPLVSAVYEVRWDGRSDDGSQLSSGVYFITLTAGSFSQSKKLLLVR